MEDLIWWTYWSGAVPYLGYVIMIPLGVGIYSWLWLLLAWQLLELFLGKGDFGLWFIGPFRRVVVGSFIIYPLAVLNALIPIWGILTSWLFGLWANADYYDYAYPWPDG